MRYLFILVAALAVLLPARAGAQASPAPVDAWNGERALDLIRTAQQRRSAAFADTGLVNYQSDARIYVYFYLDREDTGERNLVKTDQLALEVFWQAPDQVKQRIVGWRDEKSLPTNINYHLDHLTVVHENFGDEIRLGDGDEVRNVPHPAAPGAEEFYEYRLADSLTLRLPGAAEPVRVYELQVRPRDASQPAFVGSVFVERRQGDIVRMDFTFTSAAYVDRYLDYINISLDNGLWRGRFWLPNQQRVEIRRRIPQLDIPAGSVIRASMRIGGYEFNQPLPPLTFVGPPVVALPPAQRRAFPFEEDIHAEVRAEGLGPQVELGEIRRMAAELAREQALRRVSGIRLRIPSASDVLRYNRAEGLALGLGATITPAPGLRLGAHGGYAFGAEHPFASLSAETRGGATSARASLYLNRPRDAGLGPVASGTLNTLASLFAAEDYTDLFFADGGEVEVSRRLSPAWSLGAQGRVERQSFAPNSTDFSVFGGDFRPALGINETDRFVGGRLGVERVALSEAARWWTLGARVEMGWGEFYGPSGRQAPPEEMAFAKPIVELGWGRRWQARDATLRARVSGGAAAGDLPTQELYLLGGRGTLPGYDFRARGGDRFALADATLSMNLWRPWLRARAFGAVGAAGVGSLGEPLPSLGIGVGLLHDILRVDLARGLGDAGRWELIVEAQPSFWDFL